MVLESTTYPGTTRERLVPMLEESGLAAERDFFVAFSPERVDPGRTDHTLRTTPKVVGAVTPESLERAVALYELRLRRGGHGLHARGGRAHQAARERLPLGEHRAGERAGDALRPHGRGHLGGGGRRRHQALRVHVLQAGPGHGRPLPAGGPVLPGLAGARVRPAHRVHRAGRRGEPADALLLRREDRPRPQRPLAPDQGLADRAWSACPTRPAWATCASRPA